jgi:hypothetical protein
LSGNPPEHVRLLSKNLFLNQNLHFWFISSIYLDLCDHVKILRCLNRKWIIDKEDLSWTISLCDLEQSYTFLGGKQQRFYQANRDHIFLRSFPSLSSRSLSSQIPVNVLAQNFLMKRLLMFLKVKIHLFWRSYNPL